MSKAVKKPLTLAIIIPVYNEERYLGECLQSIASQTQKPDEVVVVDNNSTDDSVKIAKTFPFVKIISESYQGIVFARDRGFDSCKSDIIGRIDADSVLPEDWVEHVRGFYKNPAHRKKHAWTGGGIFRNSMFPRVYGWFLSQIAYRMNRLLMGHYILWGSNMAITREQWEQVRSRVCRRNDIHEDLDLAIHLHQQDFQISYHAFFKVSVIMRRIHKPETLKSNLLLWPTTLKQHDKKTWIGGWIGAYLLYFARHVLSWSVRPDGSR